MEELKSKPNYQKEIGYGLLFGPFQDIMSMVNGLLVVKLISWKVEEMLGILDSSEEDLKLSAQLCIGELISSQINTLKLTLKNPQQVELSLMPSTHTVYIGTTKSFILILIMTQIKYYKLIIHHKAIGKDQELLIDIILGSIQKIKMLLLIDPSILFLIWQSEEQRGISEMELQLNPGLITRKEPLLSSMTTKDNGGQLGDNKALSNLTQSKFGISPPTAPKNNLNPLENQIFPNNDHHYSDNNTFL